MHLPRKPLKLFLDLQLLMFPLLLQHLTLLLLILSLGYQKHLEKVQVIDCAGILQTLEITFCHTVKLSYLIAN